MARTGMESSAKFRVLVRRIGLAKPFVRGLLETLWDTCHATGSPVVGDAFAVEAASEWPGEDGAWFEVLRDGGWIDPVPGGRWRVHDYWHHAPSYVAKRESRKLGMTYAAFLAAKAAEEGCERNATESCDPPVDSERNPVDSESLASPGKTRQDKTRNPPNPPSGGTVAKAAEDVPVPESLGTPEFRGRWAEWLAYRREKRKAVLPRSAEKTLRRLAAWGPAGACQSIEESIANGWAGLFEPRATGPPGAKAAAGGYVPMSEKIRLYRESQAAKGAGGGSEPIGF